MLASDIDKELREQRREQIASMWLACYTHDEIGETTAIAKTQVSEQLEVCSDLAALPKQNKLLATYTDAECRPRARGAHQN